jgi:hypothetical protein
MPVRIHLVALFRMKKEALIAPAALRAAIAGNVSLFV